MNSSDRIWAIACITMLSLFQFTSQSSAETDANICYGETLEVQMYVFAPDQPNGGEVILSLPNPESWTLIARDGRSLHDAGCQEEPVIITKAYSSGMQNKFTVALNKIGAPAAVKDVTSLSLWGGLPVSPSEGQYKYRSTGQSNSEWYPVENGFRRLNSKGNELFMSFSGRRFAAGNFYFPDHHPAPMGHPVEARCSRFGFCQVDYRLQERLGLKYKFRSSIEYDTKWIPQDQALRVLVNSWITDLPLKE